MDSDEEISQPSEYYYDPVTKRYYVDQRFDCVLLKNTPSQTDEILDNIPKLPKNPFTLLKHLPDLLDKRQFGFKQSNPFDSNWLKLKTRDLPMPKELTLDSPIRSIDDIVYLRGGVNSLYGEWRSGIANPEANESSYIIELQHEFTSSELKRNHLKPSGVTFKVGLTDMCEGFSPPLCLLYVGNHMNSQCGMTRVIWRPEGRSNMLEPYRHFVIASPIWCCCSNNFTEKFALGIRNGIAINTVSSHLYSRSFIGNVHSVHFNKMGSVVYSGSHSGKLIISDLRVAGTILQKQIDTQGIDETVLLSEENYLICGGFRGLLCRVDLRMERVVAEFFGHVHTPRKQPFSISENHNYLSATGSDNITRLWSLDGGEPLKCIPPVEKEIPSRSWLVTDGWKCILYVIQRKKAFMYQV